MQPLNLNAFGVLFLLRTAKGIKADSFKINVSQFFSSPTTLLTKSSEHVNTAVHLIMLISYLTINFKGTFTLKAFHLPLYCLYICPVALNACTIPK